jgi:hypothetical protein
MSQPPSSPYGVGVPGAGEPGHWGEPVGSDDPTRQFGPPGQREPTRRLEQPAPHAPQNYGYPPPGQYAQAPYAQAPYGPAPYGPPWTPPAPRQKPGRRLGIVLVLAAVVLLAVGGVAWWLLIGRGDDSSSLPAATVTPDDLGFDPLLDAYALDCYEGDMQACDELFVAAESGSLYQLYGDTCAGRQPSGTNVFCTVSYPAE